MIIENLKHQYFVIFKKEETADYISMVCRQLIENDSRRFQVYCIKNTDQIKYLLPIFLDTSDKKQLDDFYEIFSKNGFLYLVFICEEGTKITELLEQESYSLTERLDMGKRILEKILLMDIPKFLLYPVLKNTAIFFDQNYDVSFSYSIDGILKDKAKLNEEIILELARIFEQIFVNEISLRKSASIELFVDGLKQEPHKGLFSVFQEYTRLCDKLREKKEIHMRPNTFWFRVWDKIKQLFPIINKIILTGIALLLGGYLLYTLLKPKIPEEYVVFDRIGTLEIVEKETIQKKEAAFYGGRVWQEKRQKLY